MANGLLDFFNSPTTALAAGLLAPSPQGTFGGGLLQGLGAMNTQQQSLRRQQMADVDEQYKRAQILRAQQQSKNGFNVPMSVKEFEYYQKLPSQAEKNTFMNLKRQQYMNLGGHVGMPDPTGGGGVMGVIPKTIPPQDLPSTRGAQAGAAEQAQSDVELEMQPKITTATMQAEKGEKMRVLPETLDMAEIILRGKQAPTASGIGAAADVAAGFFGQSLPGATEAAKLKALGASLVTKMPRMEGQQSDKDVKLYKEQAGRIGDPTVPIEERLGALETIRELTKKYQLSPNPQQSWSTDKEKRYQEWKANQ